VAVSPIHAMSRVGDGLPLGEVSNMSESEWTYGCAPVEHQSMCSCYALDNGLLIDCKITAIYQMKDVLKLLISQPIKSFSLFPLIKH